MYIRNSIKYQLSINITMWYRSEDKELILFFQKGFSFVMASKYDAAAR